MTAWGFLPVLIAATLAASAVVARHTNRRIQSARLELARRGEVLLKREDLSDDARFMVEMQLDSAFSWRAPMFVLFPAVPVSGILMLFSRRLRKALSSPIDAGTAANNRELIEICGLHSLITLANHTLLMPALYVWTALWWGPALMASRLFDKESAPEFNEAVLFRVIEQRAHAA